MDSPVRARVRKGRSDRIVLPRWVRGRLATEARRFLFEGGEPRPDFRSPPGEPALLPPDCVSWRVFKNPVALFIGGITAVVLELGEPRVRSGVWDHTSFRSNPVPRLRRTGLAAMVTVYGARSQAEAMIAGVRRMHERVSGTTPAGVPYEANDPELLDWVQATATFGFLEAYRHYAAPLSDEDISRYYAEGEQAAWLYGATGAPRSQAELAALFERMAAKLEPSPILLEFLHIMMRAPLMPRAFRVLQAMLVRAGVDIVPANLRARLELGRKWRLAPWERRLIGAAARLAERTPLEDTPPVQACERLGLPGSYLYS